MKTFYNHCKSRQTARLLAFSLALAVIAGGAFAQTNVGKSQSFSKIEQSGENIIPSQDGVTDLGTSANSFDDLVMDGDATIGGTLTVTGAQTFTGAPTITGTLTANGNVVLGNDATDTITITGATTATMAMTADSAATNKTLDLNITSPVDTTGTNSHYALQIDATIGNASGGTNTVRGINIAAITGDAQVNVDAIAVGAGTVLGVGRGIFVDGGWDTAVEIDVEATADSGQTSNGIDIDLVSPVDTTGTNSHFGLNIDTTIGNASGGTNSVNAINIANVTGDAQVNVIGLKIGTGTTLGTSNAIDVGTGWDAGLNINSPITGNGVASMAGVIKTVVAATATSVTIAQSGATFVNSGAVQMELPEASTAIGAEYTFAVGNAANFNVNPDNADTILPFDDSDGGALISPSAGDMIRCAVVGGTITLRAVSASEWIVTARNQDWADAN